MRYEVVSRSKPENMNEIISFWKKFLTALPVLVAFVFTFIFDQYQYAFFILISVAIGSGIYYLLKLGKLRNKDLKADEMLLEMRIAQLEQKVAWKEAVAAQKAKRQKELIEWFKN
jgi:hypothetical protein